MSALADRLGRLRAQAGQVPGAAQPMLRSPSVPSTMAVAGGGAHGAAQGSAHASATPVPHAVAPSPSSSPSPSPSPPRGSPVGAGPAATHSGPTSAPESSNAVLPTPEAMVARLRGLLRLRAPDTSVPCAAGVVDRRLPGEEIAPGLFYAERWTPWPRGPEVLSLHGLGCDPVPRDTLLAFDTETTGLAGGTGTRAFMVGAADWRDGGLRVRQLCLATLGAEAAMLQAFAGWLADDTVLVSYNGKSYDRPLLSTRYRLARLPDPLATCRHIDLLHPVRRRYRGAWANCRLATVERELLGIVREDDLPGSEAPAAWLDYLRGGSAATLRRVAAHNHQDVRSLCSLLEAMADPAPSPALAARFSGAGPAVMAASAGRCVVP